MFIETAERIDPPTVQHPVDTVLIDLETRGWSAIPHFLPESEIAELRARALGLVEADAFQPAAIGNRAVRRTASDIRSDRICWVDPQDDERDPLRQWIEPLRQAINRQLMLGLLDIECHFALYRPGAFYGKHLDSFRDDDRRRVTIILYLNRDWRHEDGGELLLYEDRESADAVRILPEGGTLVVFLSDRFPHEVLPARRDRLSLTGWFRVRELSRLY